MAKSAIIISVIAVAASVVFSAIPEREAVQTELVNNNARIQQINELFPE